MGTFFPLVLLFISYSHGLDPGESDTLIMLQVLQRHGQRASESDPYITESAAAVFKRGHGELSDEGILRTRIIGTEYRKRYVEIDPPLFDGEFMPEQVSFRASEVSRVLMSAGSMAAGLFRTGLLAVLPPIYSYPYASDTLLAPQFACEDGWDDLIDKYDLGPSSGNMAADVLAAMRAREWNCTSPAADRSDTVLGEYANLRTRIDLTDDQRTCAKSEARRFMFNMEMCYRESGGPCDQIPIGKIYVAHDLNLLALMNVWSMQQGSRDIFMGLTPEFGSSLAMELWRTSDLRTYIRMYLHNGAFSDFQEFQFCQYISEGDAFPRVGNYCTIEALEAAKAFYIDDTDPSCVLPTTTTTMSPTCCLSPTGVWSEWETTGVCSTSCGSCSNSTRKRECLSDSTTCPCTGEKEEVGPCGTAPCPFSGGLTCCFNYTTSLNGNTGQVFCGNGNTPADPTECSTSTPSTPSTSSTTESTTSPPLCCHPEGVWGEWVTNGQCATTCGACSTRPRSRVCLSESDGCSCSGDSEDSGPCAISLCPFPGTTCCGTYKKRQNYNTGLQFCGDADVPEYSPPDCSPPEENCCPAGGLWTEWQSSGECGSTCGSCHTLSRTRTCVSESDGCPCTGPDSEQGPCGTALCPWPADTCCKPFMKSINYKSDQFYCGMADDVPPPSTSCCPQNSSSYWSEWEEWTDTCLTTGGRTRVRVCAGREKACDCDGDATENESCCCPPGGVWSEWTPTSGTCKTTCGSCTITPRKRTCASAQYGCECSGADTDEGPCSRAPCPAGNVCCSGFEIMQNPNTGSHYCGNAETEVPLSSCCTEENQGSWTDWTNWGGICTTSPCGLCDRETRNRTCTHGGSGCPCDGEASQTRGCGNNTLCSFPQKSCCAPYTIHNSQNEQFCG